MTTEEIRNHIAAVAERFHPWPGPSSFWDEAAAVIHTALAAEEQARHVHLLGIRTLTAEELKEIREHFTQVDGYEQHAWVVVLKHEACRLLEEIDLLSHLLATSEEGQTLQEVYERGRQAGWLERTTERAGWPPKRGYLSGRRLIEVLGEQAKAAHAEVERRP